MNLIKLSNQILTLFNNTAFFVENKLYAPLVYILKKEELPHLFYAAAPYSNDVLYNISASLSTLAATSASVFVCAPSSINILFGFKCRE